MNIAFRTVWNAAIGAWVAVSETASARGKRSVNRRTRAGARIAGSALALSAFGVALPSWADCVNGSTPMVLDCSDTTVAPVDMANGWTINNSGTIGATGNKVYAIQGGSNVTVNNTGSVLGFANVVLGGGAVINNIGGTMVGDNRAIQVLGGPGTLVNSQGGLIQGSLNFYNGGTIRNIGSSTIETGAPYALGMLGNSTVVNEAGSTIRGGSVSVFVQEGDTVLDNAGLLVGSVALNGGDVHQVTLRPGGRVQGDLGIGSAAGSTLTLTGTGSQLYSQAVTGGTTFGAALIKNGSGTWTIDRSFAPSSVSVDAGTLAFAPGGTFTNAAATSLTAAGVTLETGPGAAARIGSLDAVAGSDLQLGVLSSLTLGSDGDSLVQGDVSGAGTLVKDGIGTLTLGGSNGAFMGTLALNGGTLVRGSATALGAARLVVGGVVDFDSQVAGILTNHIQLGAGATLRLVAGSSVLDFRGDLGGEGSLDLRDATQSSLTGNNSGFTGATRLGNTTLILGNANPLGTSTMLVEGQATLQTTAALDYSGNIGIAPATTLTLANSQALTLGGRIEGPTGSVVKNGSGTLTLSGDNSYGGTTTVNAGTLRIANTAGSATGTGSVLIGSGATLAGTGSIAGPVSIASGGRLSVGNSVGVMNTGSLTLAAGSTFDVELGQAGTVGGAYNDLLNVNGDLALGGTLNVSQSAGGMFGAGVYRLINYTGALTATGMAIGSAPVDASHLHLQTVVPNQVNLVNTQGLVLNIWDGANPVDYNDGKISGGSGTWRAGSPGDNWTTVDGSANADWVHGGFAIFGGTGGTVTVDGKGSGGPVRIGGAQFTVDGYVVGGDALTIDNAATVVRVGDGTSAGAASTAVLNAALTGSGGLVKEDAGTLVLAAANSYAGGTTVRGGTLRISADDNLGLSGTGLALDGGTLGIAAGSAPILSTRTVSLGEGGGTIDLANGLLGLVNGIEGPGGLTVRGQGGVLALAKAGSYEGGTVVQDGATVAVGASGALGTGAVQQQGSGTRLIMTAAVSAGSNSYAVGRAGSADSGNLLSFAQGATAGEARIAVHGAGWKSGAPNSLQFGDDSSAGAATITNAGGAVHFQQNASAGTAVISNGDNSLLAFHGNASAGSAKITNLAGGTVHFEGTASASKAAIVNAAGGTVDVSGATALGGIELGALSGAGAVVLGATRLTLGGLGTSDMLSGTISDKGSSFTQPGSGTGGSLVKTGSGTLTLSGANTYTGGTALKEGRLNLGHAQALGTGALAMDDGTTLGFSADGLTIANAIELTGSNDPVIDTGAFDATLAGAISGGGFITKQGTGTLTLSGANSYTGATEVAQGTLRAGAVNTFSAASAHHVAAGATLDLAGFSQTVASLRNSGTVSLAGSTPGTTLTVAGNYVGDGGVLRLGSMLGEDGSADRLVIDGGSASGRTTVQITNLGGLGALTSGNGIEVVSARNGATTTAQTSKDAFTLAGGRVDAGAYEYRLHAADAHGAGENWYLRSTTTTPAAPAAPVVTYRAEASLHAALPGQLRQGNLAMLGDLRRRVGDDDAKGSAAAPGGPQRRAWARVLSTDLDIQQGGTVSPTSSGRLTGVQAGTDLLATPNWRAGLYVGQLEGDARVRGFASGLQHFAVGRNDLRSQYLGVYGTYSHASGFYADAVLQSGRHRATTETMLGAGTTTKGHSLLGALEIGQAFALGAGGWTIEPQLQLIHQHMDLDDTAIVGAVVQPRSDSGWIARAGVRVKGEIATGAGTLQPYGRVNVYRTSSGMDLARFVNGATTTDIASPTGGTSTELAGGFTLALGQATSLYGEIGKLWASGGNARVKSSVNGSVGVRVRW